MSLSERINGLMEAMQTRTLLREKWLAMSRGQAEGDPVQVRRQHLAQDEVCERLTIELVQSLQESQADGLTEFALMTLCPDKVSALESILVERGMIGLLEPAKPDNLQDLVRAWREASIARDAARHIIKLRYACEACDLASAIDAHEAELKEAHNEESFEVRDWRRAVATFNALRSAFACQREDGGADADDLNGDAAHANERRWLKRYDTLREQLQSVVERLMETNMLSAELGDMEFADRRAVVNAIDGGLVRQLQLAVQAKPQSRWATEVQEDEATEGE